MCGLPLRRFVTYTELVVGVVVLLTPSFVDARIDVNLPPPSFTPNVDLDLSLSLNGESITDSMTLSTSTTVFPVQIHVLPKAGGSADGDPLDGSEDSRTYWNAFYLDFYQGTLFSNAVFISGEEMNFNGPIQTSSTVTFPGPGTYSAVLYDSGQIRNWDALCSPPNECYSRPTTLEQMRGGIERGLGDGNVPPASFVGIVTFTVTADSCAGGGCVSNVLFLPGIEGSRLYEGTGCGKDAEEKLWEPIGESALRILRGAGDAKVNDLFLDADGKSVCSDVYTKVGDIIDTVGGDNLYAGLVSEMNTLKSSGTMADWEPVAYDWRLSLDDLLEKGAEREGKVWYEEATSTPYIEQTLRALASTSKTGKVTIIAHSNGGLLAKALLNQLGGETAKSLVDRVILVGSPQTGAPMSIGALLFGYDQGISSRGITILSTSVARSLAYNSPMAYHLLPSEDYLESVAPDTSHRVARFAGDAYKKEISTYTTSIGNRADLRDFLLAREGGREKPSAENVNSAEILNPTLIDYGISTHSGLDFWMPPEGVEVDQVAGWGVDTLAGIDFFTLPPVVGALATLSPQRAYRPIITEDGDGTVPTPSALMLPETNNIKRYWMDLNAFYKATKVRRAHADIFEVPQIQDFIKDLLKNDTSVLPSYIQTSRPAPNDSKKKLTFFLHSPLTLQVQDSQGNVTGLATDGSLTQDIPDSSYGELGEVKYVTVPEGEYQLTLHGQDTGTFSLEVESGSGVSTFANLPVTPSTLASLTISGETPSPLIVDEDGDGKNIITLSPKIGEIVTYEPPAPVSTPPAQPGGGGAGSIAIIPITTPANTTELLVANTTESLSTTTPTVATVRVKNKKPMISTPRTSTQQKARIVVPAQTASVYTASQQSGLSRVGTAVYNGLYGLWSTLKKLF
jgi:pimeloyl-ACP methyl ester carboxylesterase